VNAPRPAAWDAVDYDPFAEASGAAPTQSLPTTEAQKEVWLACQLGSQASLAYNEAVSLQLHGPLDLQALEAAVVDLGRHHAALRATVTKDGQALLVAGTSGLTLQTQDLSALPSAARVQALAAARSDCVDRPFDLTQGPLFHATLLKLGDEHHDLLLWAHHIVCDGWSFGVLLTDLASHYAHHAGHDAAPVAPADSLADHAAAQALWLASREHAADEAFWIDQFRTPAPPLDLPTDRPRRAWRSFASQRVDHVLDASLVRELKRLSGRCGASLFSSLLAGFAVCLSRLGAGRDLVIGVPSAGQATEGFPRLVSHCVHLLPLRVQVDDQAGLSTLVKSTQGRMLDAFEHPRYTYGSLLTKLALARDSSRLVLVSVMFNLDQALDLTESGLASLRPELASVPRSHENFELFVNAVPLGDGGLRLETQYNTELFDASTVARWLGCLETLLRDGCQHPEQAVSRLDFASPGDLALLGTWNQTHAPWPEQTQVQQLFERQVKLGPDRIALRHGQQTWRYDELNRWADDLAAALAALGAGPGQLVGLHIQRGAAMVAALLAVLKTGAAYVPLDPGYPTDRLRFMIEDAGLTVLVTQGNGPAALAWPVERCLLLDGGLDALALPPTTDPTATGPTRRSGEDPAYVIYTSGSTGRPKGVQVPHRAVINYLASVARTPGLQADDRLAAVTTLSFDIAVTELWLPLAVGAQIVLATRDQAADGAALKALLEETQATLMQATPSTWRLLLETPWQGGGGFKAWCGGEALDSDLARRLLPRVGELWNLYGPTETTVWSTCGRVWPQDNAISVGRPLANTTVWVLNEQGQPCPIGVPGELFIGGAGVTQGYLHRPELTRERFVPDPFWEAYGLPTSPDQRLYRTGDLGRWRENGQLEHLGRSDLQIKVRGFRIEVGEIEAALQALPGVGQAVVSAVRPRPDDVRLVAYLVMHQGTAPDLAHMRHHLQQVLPDYMLPQHLVAMSSLPLLPNGKVNRQALKAPDLSLQRGRPSAAIAARSPLEALVVRAMEAALGLPDLSMDDNFFALGGHSLTAARLVASLSRELEQGVSLKDLFEAPTPQALSALLASRQTRAGQSSGHLPEIPLRTDRALAPLTVMQQRLWFLEQMTPGRVMYNTPSAHRLTGELDRAAMLRAWQAVVARQSVLRTSIERDGDEPLQRVHAQVAVEMPVEDLSDLAPPAREARLNARLQELANLAMDLSTPPLFRLHLFRLEAQCHVLFFMPHHVIWDGWSFDLLYAEVAALYAHETQATPVELPALGCDYGDFAAWQSTWHRSPEFARQLKHWTESFKGSIDITPLPADRPRKAGMSGQGLTEWMQTDADLTRALQQRASEQDCTLFMILMTVFCALVHQISGERKLIIGTPVRGRPTAELEPLMGFFTNLLLVQVEVVPGQSMLQLLAQVRTAVLEAFTYPDVPMEHLMRELHVRRTAGGSLLYHALFSFQDVRHRPTHWGALQHERVEVVSSGATEDLGCWFVQGETQLMGGVTFNADVLLPQTGQLLRDRYQDLIAAFARNPHQSLAQALAMGQRESERVAQWQAPVLPAAATGSSTTRWTGISDRLAELATQAPDHATLLLQGGALSRAELSRNATRLAHHWLKAGVHAGDRLGLMLPQGPDRLTALLASFQLGCCAILLDPEPSSSWVQASLQVTRPDWLVDAATQSHALAQNATTWRRLDTLAPPNRDNTAALPLLDRPGPGVMGVIPGESNLPQCFGWDEAALVNAASALASRLAITPATQCWLDGVMGDDRSLAALLPLLAGAQVWLTNTSPVHHPGPPPGLVAATASQLCGWLDDGWQPTDHQQVLCLGEVLDELLANRLLASAVSLWQGLGLMTAPDPLGTLGPVIHADFHASVGLPTAGFRAEIRDEAHVPVVIGRPGELCLLNPNGDAVRTGARARWSSDGRLEWLGMMGQAQACAGRPLLTAPLDRSLMTVSGVLEATTAVLPVTTGPQRIVVYLALDSRQDPSATLARAKVQLAGRLPASCMPARWVLLGQLPRLANGEVDHAGLPQFEGADMAAGSSRFVAARNPTEAALVKIWTELLDVAQISVHDRFFDIGGYSLLAVQMFARIERRFGINLPLSSLLQHQTCAGLAALIHPDPATGKPGPAGEDWTPLVCIRRGGGSPPLFCIHAVGGNVLNYRVLAGALPPEQPVYGLQAIGLDGVTPPLHDIETMAARYCDEIRQVQAHGPYFLCGGSLGGTLAFEMARQLVNRGEAIGLLALFDTSGPSRHTAPALTSGGGAKLGQWVIKTWRALRSGQWQRFGQALSARGQRLGDWCIASGYRWRRLPVPQHVRWRIVESCNHRAYLHYVEPPFDGKMTLFRALDEPGSDDRALDLGWRQVATGGVDIISLPGTHRDFIEQPELAHRLRALLEQAQQQQQQQHQQHHQQQQQHQPNGPPQSSA
jgi:amino acid adenylation domain-containing protein